MCYLSVATMSHLDEWGEAAGDLGAAARTPPPVTSAKFAL